MPHLTETFCEPAGLAGAMHTMLVVVMVCVVLQALPLMDTEHAEPKPFPVTVTDTLPSVLMLGGEMLLSVGRTYETDVVLDTTLAHMMVTACSPTSIAGAVQVNMEGELAAGSVHAEAPTLAVHPVEKLVPLTIRLPPPVPIGPVEVDTVGIADASPGRVWVNNIRLQQ
jgi:hypothetical protein